MFGGGTYPLILPNTRDPRLHVAAVIITIHVLGQVALRFQVTEETYDSSGTLRSQQSSPFATMFVVRRATGGRWLDVAELPPGPGN